MKAAMKILGQFLITTALLWSTHVFAQIGIIATINQQPVTNYDVEQRALFLEFATNIEITDQNRERIFEDALQLIIDDKLRLAEVKTLFPDVEALVMPQVRDFMNQNFGRAGKSGSAVLRDAGIDPMTVQQKYISDIAWSNYISERFSEKFSNIETLIDDEIERIKLNASKPQLKLSEIVLVPGQARSLEATQALAEEMIAAIKKGASFAEIARQYSIAGSASRGGNIGWVVMEKLPRTFREALAGLDNGAVTAPILLDGAVYILRRAGERKDGLVDVTQARVWLARAILPINAKASEAERLEAAAVVSRDTQDVANCDAMTTLNDGYGSGAVSRLDDMLVADMAPQMQQLISKLEPGKPSEPLAFAEGIASLMLCKRQEPKLDLPERAEIRQAYLDRIYGSLSERQVLKLRRMAVIERRDQ